MSETKWTNGPWKKDLGDGPWRVLACDDRETIICEISGARANAASIAEANLIASAPALYEALDFAVEALESAEIVAQMSGCHLTPLALRAIREASAALRLARGE